jgi:DNA-binding transcriptional ArsR family regulator
MAQPNEHTPATEPLSREEAERLSEAMSAFTASSRLRLLYGLLDGERSVEELALASGVTATVASQQLRVLRHLRAVAVRRDGRRAFYRLHDHHMADLLTAIRHHGEHGQARDQPLHVSVDAADSA